MFVTRRGARLLGCLGAMAATVIIAVDNVIGVIGQQFIMPGLGAELSQQSTVHTCVCINSGCSISRPCHAPPGVTGVSPPSPALAGDRTPLRSTPQLPAAIYLVNNIRNH